MKKILFLFTLAALALTVSCNVLENRTECLAPVTVRISDLTASMDEFPTKSQSVADYTNIKALTLGFYNGETEIYKHTQIRDSIATYTTFGEFSAALPLGTYTMVVLGYGLSDGEPVITLTSPTSASFGDHPARETFATTQAVSITSMEAVELSATLDRIISKLHVVSSDKRTADATKVRMTFSKGGKAFNPTTGLATTNTGFSNTLTTSTAVGVISQSNSYLFLATDEQTMNVTIETLDDDNNVVLSKTINDVPFKRNRVTTLTGAIYSATASASSFQVNNEWLSEYAMTF